MELLHIYNSVLAFADRDKVQIEQALKDGDFGVDDAVGELGENLMYAGVYANQIWLVEMLLEHGADPRYKFASNKEQFEKYAGKEGMTTLSFAVIGYIVEGSQAKEDIIRTLLKAGADPKQFSEVENDEGREAACSLGAMLRAAGTFLSHAEQGVPFVGEIPQDPQDVKKRALNMYHLLVEHGAHTALVYEGGKTAYDFAREEKLFEIADLLAERNRIKKQHLFEKNFEIVNQHLTVSHRPKRRTPTKK